MTTGMTTNMTTNMTTKEKALHIIKLLDDKKGDNLRLIDVRSITSLTDYMIFCTGNSQTHVNSLAEYTADEMKKGGNPATHMDGFRTTKWVILDYVDIMVHVMGKEERLFYNIEDMWGMGTDIPLKNHADEHGEHGK